MHAQSYIHTRSSTRHTYEEYGDVQMSSFVRQGESCITVTCEQGIYIATLLDCFLILPGLFAFIG